MVADNDLALGLLVEGISQTKFWKETAIFVIEDDAQNGPDHVDAHRSPGFVISPYTKRKYVDSTMYSTSSMLRTMELILGLKPMSQFDAAARPMYNSFTATPDLTPYKHEVPKTKLDAVNVAGAWGQEWSQQANMDKEDAADDLKFNEVIWKSVKGAQAHMPAPVRRPSFCLRKRRMRTMTMMIEDSQANSTAICGILQATESEIQSIRSLKGTENCTRRTQRWEECWPPPRLSHWKMHTG